MVLDGMLKLKYLETNVGVPIAEKHGAVTRTLRAFDEDSTGQDWFDIRLAASGWVFTRFKGEGDALIISPSTAHIARVSATEIATFGRAAQDARPAKPPR